MAVEKPSERAAPDPYFFKENLNEAMRIIMKDSIHRRLYLHTIQHTLLSYSD